MADQGSQRGAKKPTPVMPPDLDWEKYSTGREIARFDLIKAALTGVASLLPGGDRTNTNLARRALELADAVIKEMEK